MTPHALWVNSAGKKLSRGPGDTRHINNPRIPVTSFRKSLRSKREISSATGSEHDPNISRGICNLYYNAIGAEFFGNSVCKLFVVSHNCRFATKAKLAFDHNQAVEFESAADYGIQNIWTITSRQIGDVVDIRVVIMIRSMDNAATRMKQGLDKRYRVNTSSKNGRIHNYGHTRNRIQNDNTWGHMRLIAHEGIDYWQACFKVSRTDSYKGVDSTVSKNF